MKEYSVYFSLYSEEDGEFQEKVIRVDAEDQFEARRMAWEGSEVDAEFDFSSNIKLGGVVWSASPLDLQDYFNAATAHDKYQLHYLDNVLIPNAQKDGNPTDSYKQQKYEHYGSLQTIFTIAKDMGQPFGMPPPTIHEEIHYAREFLSLLNTDFERYNAFDTLIQRAEKWDVSAMHSLQEGLRHGYYSANGMEFDFSKQFVKEDLYPARASLTDSDSTYIYRWQNARKYNTLNQLRFFDEKDVIAGSEAMQYDWHNLVLKRGVLRPEHETPINSVWTASKGNEANYVTNGCGMITCENRITGKTLEFRRSDFIGVLKPEISANIDYEAIKKEFEATIKVCAGQGAEDDGEWDMED